MGPSGEGPRAPRGICLDFALGGVLLREGRRKASLLFIKWTEVPRERGLPIALCRAQGCAVTSTGPGHFCFCGSFFP